MKSKVDKKARIRNANKKQPFFNWQIKEFYPRMIPWIETPHAHFRENNIPNNEENSRNQDGRKNSFPAFDVLHPTFKTVQKRNNEGCDI